VVSDRIAHELGHYLGLDDSSCENAIMGPNVFVVNNDGTTSFFTNRRVLIDECCTADSNSMTDYEMEEMGCSYSANCDPYSSSGWSSPILLDLDRNQFHLSGDPVPFDLNADGVREMTYWTRGDHRDAFLCMDRNGNGQIDDGTELFGNTTVLTNGLRARHGYLALGEFDESHLGGNFDGKITPEDALFDSLCLWIDSNHDGQSETWEIFSLQDLGVAAINLDHRISPREDPLGNLLLYKGTAWIESGGKLKKIVTTDVFFASP
jgi:hypothetical protein